MKSASLPRGDQRLIQIVDAALAETARKSGDWLVCRPGCTQCCVGVFAINQLDAARLRKGMADLKRESTERAAKVRQRAQEAVTRLAKNFPGDVETGLLAEGPSAEEQFAKFGNDEVCPALDPETGMCDVYEARPMTCRIFGPPVRSEDGLGVCELCYHGATDAEIAACEMKADSDDMESRLLDRIERETGAKGQTIVAFCLGRP